MKLSIIIPAFNEEKTIKTVIEKLKLLKINGVEKEIIVVDDGSTDASASVISNISGKAGPISRLPKPGTGGRE